MATPATPAATTAPAVPAVPDAAAVPVPEQIDDFASAFTEAVEADTPAPAGAQAFAPGAQAPAGAQAAPAPAVPEGTQAPDGAQAAPAPEGAQAPAPVAAAPPETPEAKMARLEAENATLRAPKPAAQPAPAAPAPAPAPAPAEDKIPDPVWYALKEDEKAAVEHFKKEWPDVAAAYEVMNRQSVYNAVQYMFSEMRKAYDPTIKQLGETIEALAEDSVLGSLRRQHSDYDAIHDDVVKWVDTLSPAFKAGAKQIIESGSVEDVASLVSEYKKAKGITTAAAPGAAAPVPVPAAPPRTELSAAAKKAAGKLEVVGSKRSTTQAGADPNDFDAAWAEANAASV